MTSNMLIATRFGLGIKDPAWFEHRLVLLASITAPSLLAQEDQRFEWVLFVDRDLPQGVRAKLGEILAPFEGRAHIWSDSREPNSLYELAERRKLIDDQGALLVGRIDDDDAWSPKTVADVRMRVERWLATKADAPGFGMTYEHGLVWAMYDMVDLDRPDEPAVLEAAVRRYVHGFHSMSGYTYAAPLSALRALVTSHARVEKLMKERAYTVEIIATDEPMWLYCRHKQTDSPVRRGEGPELACTVADLEAKFGISAARAQAYISNRDRYGYVKSLRMLDLRANAMRELRCIRRKLARKTEEEMRGHPLLERQASVLAELEELSGDAVEKPDRGG